MEPPSPPTQHSSQKKTTSMHETRNQPAPPWQQESSSQKQTSVHETRYEAGCALHREWQPTQGRVDPSSPDRAASDDRKRAFVAEPEPEPQSASQQHLRVINRRLATGTTEKRKRPFVAILLPRPCSSSGSSSSSSSSNGSSSSSSSSKQQLL